MRKTTEVKHISVPTRAPAKMQMYAKTLAFASGKPLKVMFRDATQRFLSEKPWEQGLQWRTTKGLTTTLKGSLGKKEPTGWMQVNMVLPVEFQQTMIQLAQEQGVSLSSVAYTVMYWWTWWVYPPLSERVRREAYLRRDS